MQRYVMSSIAGGAVSLIAVILVILSVRELDATTASEMLTIGITTFALGSIAGTLIEWFVERLRRTNETLASHLENLTNAQNEVNDATTVLCRLLMKHADAIRLNPDKQLEKWILEVLFKAFTKVPVDDPDRAREIYCQHLQRALLLAGPKSVWLGIHEDSLRFFTDAKHQHETGEYVRDLSRHKGKKYRIIVENEQNRADFNNADLLKAYLDSEGAAGVESYRISRNEFNALVRPQAGSSVADWALYGEQIVLEFAKEQKLIVFHINNQATKGMKDLLREIRLPALKRSVQLQSIDRDYVAALSHRQASSPMST